MLSYKNIESAIEKANELSAQRLKSIEIVKRFDFNKQMTDEFNFVVCECGNDRKHLDYFVLLVTNFECPFRVDSMSPKSGQHIDSFPTKQLADEYYSKLCKEKYRYLIYKRY